MFIYSIFRQRFGECNSFCLRLTPRNSSRCWLSSISEIFHIHSTYFNTIFGSRMSNFYPIFPVLVFEPHGLCVNVNFQFLWNCNCSTSSIRRLGLFVWRNKQMWVISRGSFENTLKFTLLEVGVTGCANAFIVWVLISNNVHCLRSEMDRRWHVGMR